MLEIVGHLVNHTSGVARQPGKFCQVTVSELIHFDRERIFNLGYYTWVEQQGISLANFDRRRDQGFWDELMELVPVWDGMIDRVNAALR